MKFLARLVRTFVSRMVERETDPINQARIRMLFYLLVAYAIFGLSLVVAYAYSYQLLKLIRACAIFCFSSLFIVLMYYTNAWRAISHAVLVSITLLGAWGNLLIFVQGINVATLQYIWLASALGFYMRGPKWGWFYSSINILPVFIDIIFKDKQYYVIELDPEVVLRPVYIYVLVFDFFLITFLNYFFFKTYNENFQKLTQTKNHLNETNRKLNETVDNVKRLSNARMDFLSTMSHELRTPLNGVIGLTDALLAENPRKDQKDTMSVLKFSAENLLALVNDILDFNKLDSEKVELENIPFNLTNLIKNIYANVKIKAAEKNLDLNLHISKNLKDKLINGDPTRLTQVLLNLLANAVKFTNTGFVGLSCNDIEQTQEKIKIRFVVEDTGIGIHKNRQYNIFETFTQESVSTNRNYGGTGLGLSIVKKVLELHQSEINLESELGKGSKFTFDIVFPYKLTESDTRQKDAVDDQNTIKDLSHLKVLVVEDNQINVIVLNKTLAQQGIEPAIAENGKQALKMLTEKDYDIILMDLYMPEMDGYEATRAIRNLEDSKKSTIPIIAITATVSNIVISDVLKAGMNDYLAKPFRSEDLFHKLRNLTPN